jgi:hypothetical protein
VGGSFSLASVGVAAIAQASATIEIPVRIIDNP